jgi:hypothetical protein
MHGSIWKFLGNPDELLRGYDAMAAEIPSANMKLHLCLRAADGIIVVDTCPTKEAYDAFVANPGVRLLRERHGLPEPERLDDFPVHVAFVAGQRVV